MHGPKGLTAGWLGTYADGPTDSQAMGQPQAALLDANMAKARQVAPSTLQHTDDDANKENGVPVPQGPDPAEAQVGCTPCSWLSAAADWARTLLCSAC